MEQGKTEKFWYMFLEVEGVTKDIAKKIVSYYADIPDMLTFETKWRKSMEDKYYNGMTSPALDGLGCENRSTEKMAMKAAADGVGESMEKALERVHLLENDMRVIRSAIECMNSRYKKCILWRHVSKYSWTKISYQFSQPESTVRYCYDKALEHLGEILDKDVPDLEGLTDRASRAY